jgi:hypothetical protein
MLHARLYFIAKIRAHKPLIKGSAALDHAPVKMYIASKKYIMPRTSPVYYIAPSAISIIPNANGSPDDLSVYVVRGSKIKVYSPKAGIDMEYSLFREWALSGRNRRLGDSEKPYTIYVRLNKNDNTKSYVVFAAKNSIGGEWKDKYDYVTKDGLSNIDGAARSNTYWYVRIGDVSLPVEGERTVSLDTGILGTDEYNTGWKIDPDALPTRIEFSNSIGVDVPFLKFGDSMTLYPALIEGFDTDISDRVQRWEVTRSTGDAQGDASWHGRLGADGSLLISHDLNDVDDFGFATAAAFNFTAWGDDQEVPLAEGSFTVMAEGGDISLGFYTDGDDPTPIVGLAVRPASIDETVKPYLLYGQNDVSGKVTAWLWERDSNYPDLDLAWKNSARVDPDDPTSPLKSVTRTLHITTDDLPAGWDANNGKVGFKCTATFNYGGEDTEIINRISIV